MPKLDLLRLKPAAELQPQSMMATLGNLPKPVDKEDVYTMSFIDSQKFSPIHSVIYQPELDNIKSTIGSLHPRSAQRLVSLQDDFEP